MMSKNAEETIKKLQDQTYMAKAMAAGMAMAAGDNSKLEELKREELAETSERNKEALSALWDIYDADKNGELDAKEMDSFMGLFLNQMIKFNEQFVAQRFTDMVQQMLPPIPGMQSKLGDYLDTLGQKIPAIVQEYAKPKLNKDFSVSVLKAMDVNSDGTIEKSEFMSTFFKAFNDKFDTEGMQKALMQKLLPEIQSNVTRILQEAMQGN